MEKRDMVSKESFEAFKKVRQSGQTNMLDIRRVGELSGLQLEIVRDIIHNYAFLANKYEVKDE